MTLIKKALRKGFNTPVLNNWVLNNVYIALKLDPWLNSVVNPYVLSYAPDPNKSLQEIAGYSDTPEINEVIAKIRHYVQRAKKEYLKPGAAVLDLGCGPGMYLQDFTDLPSGEGVGYQIHGVDISQHMIDFAQREYPNGTFYTGNLIEVDFGTKSFDFISSHGMLEFITRSDVPKMFRKVHQLLKPGGIFLMSYPHATSWADTMYSDLKYFSYSPDLVNKLNEPLFNILTHEHVLHERYVGKYDQHPIVPQNSQYTRTCRNSSIFIAQKQ